jgi:hypothetical protein
LLLAPELPMVQCRMKGGSGQRNDKSPLPKLVILDLLEDDEIIHGGSAGHMLFESAAFTSKGPQSNQYTQGRNNAS